MVSLYSTIKMMHGPINIRLTCKFLRICKVPRATFRLQTKLERAHYQEKETNRLKSKRNQMANREKLKPITRNKLLVYVAVIKPIWTYGIELWGCASKSNAAIIQRSQ